MRFLASFVVAAAISGGASAQTPAPVPALPAPAGQAPVSSERPVIQLPATVCDLPVPAPEPSRTSSRQQAEKPRRPSNRLTTTEVVMREVGRTLGREVIRGILGSIFKGRR